MNEPTAIAIAAVLLVAPLTLGWIERNLEIFCFAMGLVATVCAGGASRHTIRLAAVEPLGITAAVIVAGFVFKWTRERLDRAMAPLRARVARPILVAVAVFVLAALAGIITAIVAALVLVEVMGLVRLGREARINVAVAGCFSIGLGAALTPLGEPLSALAASALGLGFGGLARLLALYVVPAMAACAALAGYFARGEYHPGRGGPHVRESTAEILLTGARVFGFVAGLILISEAYAPLARRYLPGIGDAALYWGNTISAVLDNATLVALEVHGMTLERAREAIIALLVSGGMLVPGNIPNVVIAGSLGIRSKQWAMVGLPIGLVMLGIYFALLRL